MAAPNRVNPESVAAEARDLVPAGPLAVALGGGADSAVAAWSVAGHPEVRCIFVRHGLESSAALERTARAVAAELGIDVTILDAPVQEGPSLEDRARRSRWRAIDGAIRDGETVVTGHTRDDQAETVLMNLLRGSGSAGIAGMSRSRPGVVRPLMGFTREEIRTVAEDLGLPFTDDPANEDRAHLRNRVRSELLPMLEREYRTGIAGVLARAGSLAAADDLLIDEIATHIPIIREGNAVMIPTAALATVPTAVASRTVRMALRHLLAPYPGAAADVDAVLRVAGRRADSATITGALAVTLEGPYVVIAAREPDVPEEIQIVQGRPIRFGAGAVRFEPAEGLPVRRRSTLLLDPAALDGGATLRVPAPGDRIAIAGGSKSVRTVLSEHGVPVRRRSTWPLIVSGGRIAAVVGIRVASWAQPSTSRSVAVVYERGRT